jgi:hypothetical protein
MKTHNTNPSFETQLQRETLASESLASTRVINLQLIQITLQKHTNTIMNMSFVHSFPQAILKTIQQDTNFGKTSIELYFPQQIIQCTFWPEIRSGSIATHNWEPENTNSPRLRWIEDLFLTFWKVCRSN